MCPPVIGRAAARQHFTELAELIRGLRGEVLSWAAHGDLVLIELRLSGLLGRRPLALTGVDRIVLQDDKIRERVIYFDAIPLAGTLLRRPRALAQLWKSETLRPRLARPLTSPLRGA